MSKRALIAVLVYGGPDFVPGCIESAARLVVPGEVDVLVLDDCSPDAEWSATVRTQCEASGVGYYRSPHNIGIPRNMNLAVLYAANAGYDYVAITNSDVIFPANLATAMIATAETDPSIASVTAWSNHVSSFSLVNVDPPRALGSPASVDRVSELLERHFEDRAIDIPVGVGFCMMLPVRMVEAVGRFDPIFGRGYCEEVDWCLRAKQFGFRNVLAPSAFVYHIGNATTKTVGVLEHWETSDPANDAIINLRYPTYHDELEHWDRTAGFKELCREAATELIVTGAREFGYVVEVAAIPRQELHDEARFVLSPDAWDRELSAAQGGFETTIALDGVPVLDQLESAIGTRPQAVVVRDRGDRATELSEMAAARGIPVIDTYTYPQLVTPRSAAERRSASAHARAASRG